MSKKLYTKEQMIDFAKSTCRLGNVVRSVIEDEFKALYEQPTPKEIAISAIESIGFRKDSSQYVGGYSNGEIEVCFIDRLPEFVEVVIKGHETTYKIPYGSKNYILESFKNIDPSLVPENYSA